MTNCVDFRTESNRLNIVLWPYTASPGKAEDALAKLGTSPLGTGRLWVTASRISHAGDSPDKKAGKIEWMKFTVEIILPHPRLDRVCRLIHYPDGRIENHILLSESHQIACRIVQFRVDQIDQIAPIRRNIQSNSGTPTGAAGGAFSLI